MSHIKTLTVMLRAAGEIACCWPNRFSKLLFCWRLTIAGLAYETETPLRPPRGGTPLHPTSLVIHLMYMHITSGHAHIPARTRYTPRGPVFPAGLSAFSLLPRHLHTNTVCRGPGTNTRHSTFHYWALIIGGWEAAGEPEERGRERKMEKEGGSEQDRGSDRVEGWQALLFSPPRKPI